MNLNLPITFALMALILSGCAQEQVVLPGKRDRLADVLSTAKADVAKVELENQTASLRLEAARNNANWTQGHGTPLTRANHPALSNRPVLQWSKEIGQGDSNRNRIVTEPVVANGVVFTVDSLMTLTATTEQGKTLWSKNLTPSGEKQGEANGAGLVYGQGTLFVTTGYGVLHALSAQDGSQRWSQALLGSGTTRPAYYDGVIYTVSSDATAWAIDATTGRVRWTIDSISDVNNVISSAAPAVTSKFAVFSYGSGEVQSAFRQGGLVFWNSSLSGGRAGRALGAVEDITASPVIVGSSLYAANGSGRLVAMNVNNGDRLWNTSHGALGHIWPAGDSLFFVNDLSQLVRINRTTGDVIWAVQLPSFLKINPRSSKEIVAHHGPIVAGGQVILVSNDGLMRFFDPTNGTLTHTTDIPQGATTNPVVANGTLYVVSTDGKLHAFR